MLTSELDFELPSDRIAQSPADRRDHSRLLVYQRNENELTHHHFHELPDLLPPDLNVFRNDVSVLKARITGKRPTGGSVECILLRPERKLVDTWRCLLKPGGKTARAGSEMSLANLGRIHIWIDSGLRRHLAKKVENQSAPGAGDKLTSNTRIMKSGKK